VSLRDADATHVSSDGVVADGRFILYAESQVGRGVSLRASVHTATHSKGASQRDQRHDEHEDDQSAFRKMSRRPGFSRSYRRR